MNKKQKAVLLIGAAIVILMGLFPPWYYHVIINYEQRIPFTTRGEYDYGFIFNPPPVKYDLEDEIPDKNALQYINVHVAPTIDFGRLFVQWVTVIIAASSLIFIMKDNKK